MTIVLQKHLPFDPRDQRPLPGIQPLAIEDWLIVDEAFAGQMAERTRLLETRREAVLALDDGAREAADELLDLVLAQAYPEAWEVAIRPDGIDVAIDHSDPLATLGRLVQEDLCLLQKPEGADEHLLTGAVLCFPASWTLSEKFMRPMVAIHDPVKQYDSGIAARVQRLLNGVQPGRPLWRFNALWYDDPALHQPRSMQDRRDAPSGGQAGYFRSERQCLLRLPRTGAVVFSIHTYVLDRADFPGSAV